MKLQSRTVYVLSLLFVVQFKSISVCAQVFILKRSYSTFDPNGLWTFTGKNKIVSQPLHNSKDKYGLHNSKEKYGLHNSKYKYGLHDSKDKYGIAKETTETATPTKKRGFIGPIKDPLEFMTTPQLITTFGYPAESYTIRTEDSYLLTVHRIPYSNEKKTTAVLNRTVLLHHGLLGSSADWVLTGPNKSLALILADQGYDVWLANARGNVYSRAHVHLDPNSKEFWNFTFHEIGQYDLPAVIDFIRGLKGPTEKLHYIGHSMGTTVLFVLLSTKPEYNDRIAKGIALAPVAYMSRIRSPIRLLAQYSQNIKYLMNLLGVNQFLPQNWVMKWLAEKMCELNHYEEVICENSMFVICGHDPKQFNATLMPIILGHEPAGVSTKTVIHYAQEIKNSGRFQQFDYGARRNAEVYHAPVPPQYDIRKITLPIALISGKNDWLSSDIDATNLYVKLRYAIEHYIIPNDSFNHIDFLWGIDAPSLVYTKVLDILQSSVVTN